ncbi:Cystathionine beta-lyase MetC [Hartmannibacter diazotrophicus]|uniref:Cystathionine beta-lyase MetC n=1 Tax=Hartmannibacter diazotrophicus TaxID=1482074 RepID=A0A2C9D4T1_9HYPH|nr:cystathionine beta-lyase [Hartmannibacter diazotrophicus]SON55337.1 Cystathionine beta-lyase MetC [Hartmannibacter diazotrophicus]
MSQQPDHSNLDIMTRLAHEGRHPDQQFGFVNPPVIHGSTVLYPDLETMQAGGQPYTYGRRGNPTSRSLEEALTELEGGAGSVLLPSGLAACSTALLSVLNSGDHLLMIDSVYEPVRHLCDTVLVRMGITTTYYDPLIGADISSLITPQTRAIYVEAPGSLTFEMPDIAAIVAAAKTAGLRLLMDNTWATPVFFRPLDHGFDLSISAGTKYLVGHSDAIFGSVTANAEAFGPLKETHGSLGLCASPDDIFLALRGLRTLGVRLQRHQDSALKVARWLTGRPEVKRVLHPALPGHPGHALWARDFTGSSGLFSFVTEEAPFAAVKALLNGLKLFGLGYSWGGFESLAILSKPARIRTASEWTEKGHLIRLHIGLEDAGDLIADLEAGLDRFSAAT